MFSSIFLRCQTGHTIILGLKFGAQQELTKRGAHLGWVDYNLTSEIFSRKTRLTLQSITVSINLNLLFTCQVVQLYYFPLLCAIGGFELFIFFVGWTTMMTPASLRSSLKSKNYPLKTTALIWRKHWFWKRMVTSSFRNAMSFFWFSLKQKAVL
ncbi:hypothetical protein PanWU01x14_105230 [Parasponia andersonii]|uniref:Transmembrane protein n=1 Tax=Parasponia andersonii TaxID=3476 RepID=A0A2P5D1G2_PARAD|nr:hypothetical protein PanWU01x14_105230 [Parasponia andersonii]